MLSLASKNSKNILVITFKIKVNFYWKTKDEQIVNTDEKMSPQIISYNQDLQHEIAKFMECKVISLTYDFYYTKTKIEWN